MDHDPKAYLFDIEQGYPPYCVDQKSQKETPGVQ